MNIRNPKSTRPWQHVLEPINGYVRLADLLQSNEKLNGESFNFGPGKIKNYNVKDIILKFQKYFPNLNIKYLNQKSFLSQIY